jgi:hypothetical protein
MIKQQGRSSVHFKFNKGGDETGIFNVTQEKFISKKERRSIVEVDKARIKPFSRKLTRLFESGKLSQEQTFYYEIVEVKFY